MNERDPASLIVAAKHGPPNDREIKNNRYVTLSACRAHSCEEKGLLWIDTKRNAAVFAINNNPVNIDQGECALITGSKMFGPDAIPDQFWTALDLWEAASSEMSCIVFIDRNGEGHQIPFHHAPSS